MIISYARHPRRASTAATASASLRGSAGRSERRLNAGGNDRMAENRVRPSEALRAAQLSIWFSVSRISLVTAPTSGIEWKKR
jgi:hypothetical protein